MKNIRQVARPGLIALAAGLSLTACAGKPEAAPDTALQVSRLIGDAACSSDADCATVGIGALACGGPQAYAAWSTKHTDAQALQQAVARDRSARELQIAKSGQQSICRVVPDPGAICSAARRCELRAPGGGSGPAAVR